MINLLIICFQLVLILGFLFSDFSQNIVMWHMKEIFFINKMKNKKINLGWVRCFVLEISGL